MRTRMNQFCLGKTLGRWGGEDDCKCRERKNNLPSSVSPWCHRQNIADRLPISGRKYKMLVEKCKPLWKTVLIEILKLKNARMKVIIVEPASTGAACIVLMVQVCSHVWTGYKWRPLTLAGHPLLCAIFLILCLHQSVGNPHQSGTDFISIWAENLSCNETLKPVQLIPGTC